ncbi:MAG: hypothetical protein ACI9BO_001688 [Zhongshania sp.]|jgi:hypothetical protein
MHKNKKMWLMGVASVSLLLAGNVAYASETGDAIRGYDEADDYMVPGALAGAADAVMGDGTSPGVTSIPTIGPAIDGGIATLITTAPLELLFDNIPSGDAPDPAAMLTSISEGCASADAGTTCQPAVEGALAGGDGGGGGESSDTDAPLSISGTIAPAQDTCSVSLPASFDFTFAIDQATIASNGPSATYDSEAVSTVSFTCGAERSEALQVTFSTVDDVLSPNSTVATTFESNYDGDTSGFPVNLDASVVFEDDTPASTTKTLNSDPSQSVALKAQVTLGPETEKGGTFTAEGETLYVYIN